MDQIMAKTGLKWEMAPVLGYNDLPFRRLWRQYFLPLSPFPVTFISPFVSITQDFRIERILQTPEHPSGWDPGEVPQLLGNEAPDLLRTSQVLFDHGFPVINWNLGCPVKIVARKLRGSGLLPYADQIDRILEVWLKDFKGRLSIKLRLGRFSKEESEPLLQVLNRYPLEEVILHPRLGTQLYSGTTDLEGAKAFGAKCIHSMIWSGDLNTPELINHTLKQMPSLKGVMLGRGLFANPFLLADTAAAWGLCQSVENKQEIFSRFMDHLVAQMRQKIKSEKILLDRLKGLWEYPLLNQPLSLQTLQRSETLGSFQDCLSKIPGIFQVENG